MEKLAQEMNEELEDVIKEIWDCSTDHRTVAFRNGTDHWIEVRGTFRPKINGHGRADEDSFSTTFSSVSKMQIPPRSEKDWNFLGESAQIPDSPASFELLGLLPDCYELAIKNQFTFTAVSESNFESDGITGAPNLLIHGKESLKIQDLPNLRPLERTTVTIVQRDAPPLTWLCAAAITKSLNKSSKNQNNRAFEYECPYSAIDSLPLPSAIKTSQLKKLVIFSHKQ